MNFRDVFQDKVIDYFTNEYLAGRTPNPCIACNRFVKFEALLAKAVSMGMDYIATGHYARIEYDDKAGRYLLKKSVAAGKDQTYVLYTMTQYQLARTTFSDRRIHKGPGTSPCKRVGVAGGIEAGQPGDLLCGR